MIMNEATTDSAAQRLSLIQSEIYQAAKLAQRKAESIELIAVSKTRSADEIRPLLAAGQRHFGENRVQEAQDKWPILRAEYPDTVLHLIGQLQSNKAADAVATFDVIHTLDRLSLIEALAKAMVASGRKIPCFIQVNIGEEAQKGGCAIAELPALLEASARAQIPILGLMCLPPEGVEPAPYFALLGELAARHGLQDLSMGMSADFQTAIMLGARYVRIGTALFGARH